MKKTILFLIFGLLVLPGVLGITATREVPSSVVGGKDFTVDYVGSGNDGRWGVLFIDSVEGGCIFENGNIEYKNFILSDGALTKSIKVRAPNEETTCVFKGDYITASDEGVSNTIKFSDDTIIIEEGGILPPLEGICDNTVQITDDLELSYCVIGVVIIGLIVLMKVI